MSWPSGTKAATINVDAGSDRPALARPDIKQNIDNVNAIIDTFDIAAPSNGDILVYNSSTDAWSPGAPVVGGGIDLGVTNISTGEQLVSGNIFRRTVEEFYDSNSLISITGGGFQFTLPAGTYYVEPQTIITSQNSGAEVPITLFNETDAVTTATFEFDQISTTTERMIQGGETFTIASTKTFSFRQNTVDTQSRNVSGVRIKFFKS